MLDTVLDELGDNPRGALKRIWGAKRERLFARYSGRAGKLDMDQLEESIHRYVLLYAEEFLAIRGMECD